MLVHLDIDYVKFKSQGHRSNLKVTGGKQVFGNCWDDRQWLKSRPELETVSK